MTEAAQRFLRSFKALPQADQHDVLISLLRLPIESEYGETTDVDLVHAADEVFREIEKTEQDQ